MEIDAILGKDEMKELDKRPNYMTVPAAIRELEKIEMVRLGERLTMGVSFGVMSLRRYDLDIDGAYDTF